MRICFVTLLSKGGAERQTGDIAKGLAQKHEVIIVGYHRGTEAPPTSDWVGFAPRVVSIGFGAANYLVFGPLALFRKLRTIDPDVCIQRAVGDLTGYVGGFCRLHNSRFIYHSASSWDVSPRSALWLSSSPFSLLYYTAGLTLADVVVAQTDAIAQKFKQRFFGTKKVAVIPQMYPAADVSPPKDKSLFVLWLARMVWYKRPDIFVKLARALPMFQFVMAGSGPLEEEIRRLARNTHNLTLLGAVTHDEAERLCGGASMFVNTSLFEGFPNTLLECAARETPFVSLEYDPDEVICKYGIGLHSKSFYKLTEDVRTLMEDDDMRSELGRNGRRYVLQNHSPERTISAYERVLAGLATKHRG